MRRSLSPEDRRLWEQITDSVKPLPSRDKPSLSEYLATEDRQPAPVAAAKRPRPPVLPSWQPPAPPAATHQPYLDDVTLRKIRKGKLPIDGRIDLHGMTQERAHAALHAFLKQAQVLDQRIVLVITGKGSTSGGSLRRLTPRWLAQPMFRSLAGGWRIAHPSHGGEGALYVRVRRRK